MSSDALESGYWRAYRDFYRWGAIFRGARTKQTAGGRLRHVAYAGGWKKFEPLWDFVIKTRRICRLLPVLESVLSGFGRHPASERRSSTTEPTEVTERDVA
jgi:hypothetical protein